MKYFLITYGCQMNKSDSERIASILEDIGYRPASKMNEANLIVVNMCSVRQSAVDRVYGLLPKFVKLKTKNYQLRTILTGCVLKEDRKKFVKGFDLILDIKNLPNWHKLLSYDFYGRRKCAIRHKNYLEIQPSYQNNFSAFIPISNGCNNFCAYCVVPLTRGPLVCRNHKEILEEIEHVVKIGFKEIWLLGQNVNRYHSKSKIKNQKAKIINFARLLRMVNDIPGDFWIRFTSPNPANFSNELIESMAKCQKVTPYLNLPVQSGNDEILKKMNRPYTISQYKNLVKKIRKVFKKYRKGMEREISLSTDIIVGSPGETEKQFRDTVRLFKEIKFDMAYIAKYSPRPQTTAYLMKDNIPPLEKEGRYKILTEILKETALKKNKKLIGKKIEVLIDELRIMNNESRILFGKTKAYKTVKIHNSKFLIHNSNLVGQFVKVKIVDALPWGLKGIFN